MFKRTVITLCILAISLAACAPAAATPASSMDYYESEGGKAVPSAPMEAPAAVSREQVSAFDSAGQAIPPAERLVIQNADLTIVVENPNQTKDAIASLAADLGGFVVSSQSSQYRTDDGLELPRASITIRVPSEKLEEALGQIHGLVADPNEDIRDENRSGQDVTQEYTDLNSRLRNLEDAEKQLREIMASAQKTEDVINVFNQLTSVREQIEVIKGQIKFYEESAALSAIKVQIEPLEGFAPLTIGGWKPAGVAADAFRALQKTMRFLGNALIWIIVYMLPVVLVIGLPILLVIYLVRRGRRKKSAAAPPPPAQS